MKLAAVILTNGRQECLRRTIKSWRLAMGTNRLDQIVMIDDSQDSSYSAWLQDQYPSYELHVAEKSLGFGGAIQTAWSKLRGDIDFVFHLEDDFTFKTNIDIEGMVEVLKAHPRLAQLVLKRQAWSPEEKAAGGIVEMWPDLYTEHNWNGYVWSEHDLFFSTNPSLYPIGITHNGWPSGRSSEAVFTQLLREAGYRFAFWGGKAEPPKVEHIGRKRTGVGY